MKTQLNAQTALSNWRKASSILKRVIDPFAIQFNKSISIWIPSLNQKKLRSTNSLKAFLILSGRFNPLIKQMQCKYSKSRISITRTSKQRLLNQSCHGQSIYPWNICKHHTQPKIRWKAQLKSDATHALHIYSSHGKTLGSVLLFSVNR